MKPHKSLTVIAVSAIALIGTALGVAASDMRLGRADITLAAMRTTSPAAAATCTKITAGEVAWVTLDEDGNIDQQVDAYPADTSTIVAVFQYNCVPKNTTLVTVFTYNGEQVYNDKEKLKASTSKGTYGYPLEVKEGGTFDPGEWGVEFYNNKTLLTSGTVTVGDTEADTASQPVTVQGTVTDKRTKKPIKGALIIVLNPDVKIQDFVKTQKQEDVYTASKTDAKGQFELADQVEREVEYGIIVLAQGYKPIAQEGWTVAADDPDPLELNITLTK